MKRSITSLRRTTLALLAMGLAWPGLAAAFESSWLLDGTISALVGRDPDLKIEGSESGGANAVIFVNPILAWKSSGLVFSPSLDLDYSSAAQPLQVDEDRFLFSQQMAVTLELGGTWKPRRDTRLNLFGTSHTFRGKVTKDEKWGSGLYDMDEAGAYLDWVQKWETSTPTKSTLGIQATSVGYPNYLSLDPANPIPEKDSVNTKIYLKYEIAWNTKMLFLTHVDYAVTIMNFTDKRVTDESGTLQKADGSDTDLRRDVVHNFTVGLPMEKGRHEWNVDYDLEVRDSNLTLFDSQAFAFFPDYNDYVEHAFTVGYGYELPQSWIFDAPHLSLQLTGLGRLYKTRLAEDENGKYKDGVQRDSQIQFNLSLSSPITEHWGLFWNVNSTTYASNNDDQGSAINNYEFVTTSLGAQFFY